MKYLGIDASLSATGLVMIDDQSKLIRVKEIKVKKNALDDIERCARIVEEISNFIDKDQVVVAIEDFFAGRNIKTMIKLCILGTLIRFMMKQKNIRFVVVAPKSLKKYFTGNGNASKADMVQVAREKYKFLTDSDNIADAYALARYAIDNLSNL